MDTCGPCLVLLVAQITEAQMIIPEPNSSKGFFVCRRTKSQRKANASMIWSKKPNFLSHKKDPVCHFIPAPQGAHIFQNSFQLRDDTDASWSHFFIYCLDMQGQNASPQIVVGHPADFMPTRSPFRPPMGRLCLQRRGWVLSPQLLSSHPSLQSRLLQVILHSKWGPQSLVHVPHGAKADLNYFPGYQLT